MRQKAEEGGKSQIMKDFVFLNNKEWIPYSTEDMELLKGFKPQIETISMAGVWTVVWRWVCTETRRPRT